MMESVALEAATLIALFVYQPHFVATYQLNYSRGAGHIRRHAWTFIALPLLLATLVATAWLLAGRGPVLIPPEFYGGAMMLVIAAGLHHFAAQAAAVTVRESRSPMEQRISIALRGLLFATALHGLARYAGNHGGMYSLFGVEVSGLDLPARFLSVTRTALIAVHLGFAVVALRRRWSWRAWLPWGAFALWYLSDLFIERYFYLIPGLHALQFVPYYWERTRKRGIPWGQIGVVLASLLLVFAMPNWIVGASATAAAPGVPLFGLVLFAINLHHFAMERITWKRPDGAVPVISG